MKKKVVIITEACGGGVRKHILDLLMNLNYEKYELYFLYSLNRADETMKSQLKSLENNNVKLIEIEGLCRDIEIKSDLKSFVAIKKALKEISPEIVHCHSSKAGAIGRVAAKLIGVKKIYYTPHAYVMQNPNISAKKKKIYSLIEGILSKYFTTKSINVSLGEKNFAVENKIDREYKFSVIYNGVEKSDVSCDTAKIKENLGINKDDVIIGVTARMDEQKDPFTFINIAHRIINEKKNAKFIYVGDGEYRQKISDYIEKYNLSDRIKLLGFRNDIERILQVFDVYMITSLYEGMPYSLIEALKHKLPIIATDTIGNNEIVKPEYNGFLFEVRNCKDGSEKLLKIINNKQLMRKMGDLSYDLFNEKFTLEKMIQEIEKLYDS